MERIVVLHVPSHCDENAIPWKPIERGQEWWRDCHDSENKIQNEVRGTRPKVN